MRTVTVLLDDDEELRICSCGCLTPYKVRKTSRRIYYSRKHKEMAKDARRKPKDPMRDADPMEEVR